MKESACNFYQGLTQEEVEEYYRDRTKIFFDNIGVLAQRTVHIQEDNAVFLNVGSNGVINYF